MIPKVSIIILNWNGLKDTLECLESLQKIDYNNYEVIVVDNNSSGNDVEIIREKYGDFVWKIIVNDQNLGFSGGNNVAINFALNSNADVVLLLNNDTIVEPDFLTRLVQASIEYPDAGILTPMINFYSNKSVIWSAGGKISKIKASGFTSGYNEEDKIFRKTFYCTFASGCCMYIKKDVFSKIGLLDENYFLYLEDTDFCYRASKSGFKILFVGNSTVYHKVQSTTARENFLLPIYYGLRNRLYFAKKNFPNIYYLSVFYLLVVFLIKVLVSSNKKEFLLTIRNSFIDFYTNRMGMKSF